MRLATTKETCIATEGGAEFVLAPVAIRTEYLPGGTELTTWHRVRRCDQEWLVLAASTGRELGVLCEWSDGEWGFQRIDGKQVRASILSGNSPADALRHA